LNSRSFKLKTRRWSIGPRRVPELMISRKSVSWGKDFVLVDDNCGALTGD
jgi:hypothetical protein